MVNFADLARTDTVKRTLDNKLDISILRNLSSAEIRRRMACLRLCILKLHDYYPFNNGIIHHNAPQELKKSPAMTALWLVGAEPVNWPGKAAGRCIPAAFSGSHATELLTAQSGIASDGYLFVFVLPKGYSQNIGETNRNTKNFKQVFICQVTENAVTWVEAPPEGLANTGNLYWNT